jgi:hypothetical protein
LVEGSGACGQGTVTWHDNGVTHRMQRHHTSSACGKRSVATGCYMLCTLPCMHVPQDTL